MNTRARTLLVTAALAGTASLVTAPPTSAEPKLPPVVRAHAAPCPSPISLAAQLRAEGLTAQAAHIAAVLTVRGCC